MKKNSITILGKLAAGLIQAIPNLVSKIPQIIRSIKNAFTSIDWGSVGKNIISGIGKGLSNGVGAIVNAAKNAAKKAASEKKAAKAAAKARLENADTSALSDAEFEKMVAKMREDREKAKKAATK